MQGLARVQARALAGRVLQHVRVIPLLHQTRQDSSLASSTSPPEQKESLEEHGFESTTIADILKEKGQKADGSWLWCSVDDTVFDAVKSVSLPFSKLFVFRKYVTLCSNLSIIYNCFCLLQMTAHNVGALLVVKSGEGKKLAGIITERG